MKSKKKNLGCRIFFFIVIGVVSICGLILGIAIVSSWETLTKYGGNEDVKIKTETEFADLQLLANHIQSRFPSDRIEISVKPWTSSEGDPAKDFYLWVHLTNPQFLEYQSSSEISDTAHDIAVTVYIEYPHIDTYDSIYVGITEINDSVIIVSTESSTYGFLVNDLENQSEE